MSPQNTQLKGWEARLGYAFANKACTFGVESGEG